MSDVRKLIRQAAYISMFDAGDWLPAPETW